MINEFNTPVLTPDRIPANAYHYRTVSLSIVAADVAIVYIPYQVANHTVTIVFSDATNTILDASVSVPDTIHAAPSTAGLWATNLNSTHQSLFVISGSVTAVRLTNSSGSTVKAEVNVG